MLKQKDPKNLKANVPYQRPSRWAMNELRRRIAEGLYSPDMYLPPERKLAAELGIGRRSLRVAMKRLQDEGIVERVRGRGTRVLRKIEQVGHVGVVVPVSSNALLGYPEGNLVARGIIDRLERDGFQADLCRYISRHDFPLPPSIRPITLDEVVHLHEHYTGLIFVECTYPRVCEYVLALEARHYPVVVANLETDVAVSASRVDHARLMKKAVEILVGFGHRRIAYVGRRPGEYFYGRALEGYKDGLREAGLPFNDEMVAVCDRSESAEALLAAQAILDLPQPPTAFVTARDLFAAGVCRAIEHRGLRVGRDVSVISYDDISWRQDEPFLTTFREPCYELGTVAAELMLSRLMHGWQPPEQREVEAPLILRRSAGPVLEAPASAGVTLSAAAVAPGGIT